MLIRGRPAAPLLGSDFNGLTRLILQIRLESQSKPGTGMVHPDPGKEFRRRPQLFLVGIVPY